MGLGNYVWICVHYVWICDILHHVALGKFIFFNIGYKSAIFATDKWRRDTKDNGATLI